MHIAKQLPLYSLCLWILGCGASSGPQPNAANSNPDCGDWPWCNTALSAQQRTQLLLDELTLDETIQLMAGDDPQSASNGEPAVGVANGIERVGLKTVYYSDGPVGVREGMTTAHPAPLALAASFNRELARQVGIAIANEVKHKGNDVLHAPTVDNVRILSSGRVFETYGEDPYLAAQLAVPWIQGGESEGVIVNIKHYSVYHQEGLIGVPPITSAIGSRFLYNAVVDERTLRELYLPAFEAAVVKAGVGSVMCAYNYVNGEPACSSRHLLMEILREEWGFDGFVLTDYYFAQKDTAASANNGNDLEMPFGVFYSALNLQLALSTGQINEQTIDERVGNQLRTLFRYGFMDRPAYETNDDAIDKVAHASVAQRTAEQGSVLLQNNGLLPLDTVALSSIAVIGESADRYVNGGGSSAVNPFALHTPLQAIRERAGENISVQFDPGDSAEAAAATAALAELAIVFVTDNASEGEDRPCLNLSCPGDLAQNQDELISAVAAANANTIVVLQTGSAVLTPWRDTTSALLQAWYPGQNGGPAIAAILFGDINPQGKLPLSFPDSASDTPYAGNPAQYPGLPIPGSQGSTFEVQYSEGLFTGYRWYDQQQITPAFPFGYGLSYTQFDYSDLQLSGSPPNLTVSATVSNSGQMAGTEIAQLYVSMPDPSPQITQPPLQLKGFDRISLAPGQSGQVSFALDARSFSYWDISSSDWKISSGCYRIAVGGHSRDLPISTQLALAGGSCAP